MISKQYLDDERKKLWEKVLELEKEIQHKETDSEKEAKYASKKASEYRNRCEDARKTADSLVVQIKEKIKLIDGFLHEIDNSKELSSERNKSIEEILEQSNNYLKLITENKKQIDIHLSNLESTFENHPELEDEIERLDSAFTESEELHSKILALHKNSLLKKKEIDSLYYEIIGYTEEDEDTGEETVVEGLKDKLDKTYKDLNENLISLKADFTTLKDATFENYKTFAEEKDADFEEKISSWTSNYESILNKITSLLPNALTTGLSYAYSEKKKDEIEESEKYGKRFRNAAIGLVAVSLIPFAVSIISWLNDKTIQELIYDMPRLVLAILPLYIPVLWLAYSANKKQNLSKRLIEEYTHKEVISKTFEGLSTQIENIEDLGISTDLRIKLLYNIISVSSENPGKLISNYEKSDHPLTDALEQSVKLANAVERLSNVPGLNKITNVLAKKSDKILDLTAQKVKDGLDYLATNDDTSNREET